MGIDDLRFDEHGLIPCVVQQYDTGEVLMVAWMNAESFELTRETGTTWFWSRSRQELWNNTLLVKVDAAGPACHTGATSCFFRTLDVKRKDDDAHHQSEEE